MNKEHKRILVSNLYVILETNMKNLEKENYLKYLILDNENILRHYLNKNVKKVLFKTMGSLNKHYLKNNLTYVNEIYETAINIFINKHLISKWHCACITYKI